MRCPFCQFELSELSKWNEAQFQLCDRCGRLWINTAKQGPQGVLKSPLTSSPALEGVYQPEAYRKSLEARSEAV